MSENIDIHEEKPDHHYRFEIPNIIEELPLSILEFRLYCKLKRIAGDQGKCWLSVESLAASIQARPNTVKQALKKLASSFLLIKSPLIKIERRKDKNGGDISSLITIYDIWRKNGDFFRSKKKSQEGGVKIEPPGGSNGTPKEEHSQEEPSFKKRDNVKSVPPFAKQKREREPRETKTVTSKFPLRADQQPILSDLQALNLNSSNDKLYIWIRSYSPDKIYRAIEFMRNLKKSPDNPGGYFQNLLRSDILEQTDNIPKNLHFAKIFQRENNWKSLEFKKQYVKCGKSEELSFKLNPEVFAMTLQAIYDEYFE